MLARRALAVLALHGDSTANRLFTSKTGATQQQVTYDAFGGVLTDSGDASSPTYQRNLWNGGDTYSIFEVTHLGARLYDDSTGRFLQRDPLVITTSASRMNPYGFAFSDPINFLDPFGLCGASGDPRSCWDFGSNGGPLVEIILDVDGRYNVRTNEFAVGAADGTIRTMFRPSEGLAYWLRQVVP